MQRRAHRTCYYLCYFPRRKKVEKGYRRCQRSMERHLLLLEDHSLAYGIALQKLCSDPSKSRWRRRCPLFRQQLTGQKGESGYGNCEFAPPLAPPLSEETIRPRVQVTGGTGMEEENHRQLQMWQRYTALERESDIDLQPSVGAFVEG